MIIDLSNIKTFLINLEKDEEKKKSSISTLNKANISNVNIFNAIERSPGRIGLAISFKKIFSKIENHSDPILICEDDIRINKTNLLDIDKIEIPDNADALYIGISRNGYSGGINPYVEFYGKSYTQERPPYRGLVVKQINDNVYRIYNMLSAHAIILINSEYTKFLNNAIDLAIINGGHQDIVRALTMPYWNIYALNAPIFYQDGINEQETNFRISDLPSNRISNNLSLL